jgi:hypothetical protein
MLTKVVPAVVVGLLALTVPVLADRSQPAPVGQAVPENLDFGVFKRPATDADRLPKAVVESPLNERFQIIRAGDRLVAASRLVGQVAGYRFFVLPGRNDTLCFVGTKGRGADAYSAGSCDPIRSMRQGFMITATGIKNAYIVGGVAPDGYTQAAINGQTVPIVGNAFFATVPPGKITARLDGPNVRSRTKRFTMSG